MWKVIREILALVWKLLQTVIKNKLWQILKRIIFITIVITGVLAVLAFVLGKILT